MKEIEPKLANELLEKIEFAEKMSDGFYQQDKSTDHLSVSVALFDIRTHLLYHMQYEAKQ